MAQRPKSRLAPGTGIENYISPSAIRKTFNDEKAIRAEYSRMRSIIRKRIERLRKAGERSNWMYSTFGHKKDLPTAYGLSTGTMMKLMAPMARALSGAYKSDLTSIRAARKEQQSDFANQAEKSGDNETADIIRKMSSAQYGRAMKIVGMIQRVTGKALDSNQLIETAIQTVLNAAEEDKGKDRKEKQTLFSLFGRVTHELGLDEAPDGSDILAKAGEMFTAKGRIRVAYKRQQRNKKKKG